MFFGSHQHTIDDKGRLTLPAKWRSELAGGVVVTRGMDDCLFIFPKPKFEAIAVEIDEQGIVLADMRAWSRYFLGMAADAESDKQGRILIPQNLRDFAKLDGEVVVVGVVSRIEVWNPARHKETNAKIESDVVAVAERLGQVMKRAAAKADK
ncbi:MAG: division/cell wall cluster transcriptional repressor MraZ [Chloroflexi bacterium]|nr:division/cell wall cluster transcriptional repressor MraZ [Chloroflexota bacterium]